MGTILIVTEIQKGAIREASFELASIAQELAGGGQEVKSVVWGKDAAGAAEAFAKQGGGEVLLAEHDLLADYNAEAVRAVIRAAIDTTSPDLVLISNTPSGWDVAPRIAAGLDAAFVTDCFKVTSEGSGFRLFRRIFNGKLDAEIVTQGVTVATVQPGAAAAYEGSTEGSVSPLDVSLSADSLRTKFVEVKLADVKGVDLTKADIIVSGGRGVGAPEKFTEIIQPLVDALGGAMGASRPVVDAGWLPHAYQVGSSGQIVTPKLYVACGISGAIQHLVGMKNSNYIIAINKDADAPIFEVANLGVVADLFEVVPALTKAVKEAKGG